MKLIKYTAVGAAALAIGWVVGGVAILVALGQLLDEDWDDEEGGFDPSQVVDRLRAARNHKLLEAFNRLDDIA